MTATVETATGQRRLTTAKAISEAIAQEMRTNPDVFVMGEDVGPYGGIFGSTGGLIDEFGPKRIIDTPISETGFIGAGIGAATEGLRPVVELMFVDFFGVCFDQIYNHMAKIHFESGGNVAVPMVLMMAVGGGYNDAAQHSQCLWASFAHMPGMKVVVPSNPYDAKGLMTAALRYGDPVVYCEPKRIYRAIKAEVPDDDYEVQIGKASVVREGADLTIVAWGAMMREAVKAAEELAAGGVSAEVIDLRTIAPMDSDTIIGSVKKTGRLIVTHEAPRTGGIGAEIAARVYEEAFTSLLAPIERVTGYDTVMPLFKLEDYYLPNAKKIIAGAKKLMSY